MTKINDQCWYMCGPYKGYYGQAKYDEDAAIFHGEVSGTRDVITFQGRTIDALRSAFVDSVNDYLKFCKTRGESPDKPFSGRFVARVKPDLHRRLSDVAKLQGKSLNSILSECLETALGPGHGWPPESNSAPRSDRRVGRKKSKKPGRPLNRPKNVA